MRLQELLEESVKREAVNNSQHLTDKLRTTCADAHWPMDVVSVLSIREEDNGYRVFYPNFVKDKVHVLEYGDQDNPPTAVIRNFMRTNLTQSGGDE